MAAGGLANRPTDMADGGRAEQQQADMIERAARRLAAAFGLGGTWTTTDLQHGPASRWERAADGEGNGSEHMPASTPELRITRRSETLQRASRAMSEADILALPSVHHALVNRWQVGNSLRAGDGRNPHRVREFLWWQSTRSIAVSPRSRMDTDALGALALAQLKGPLRPWFELYALERWQHWPTVALHALACGLHPIATEDAAARVLWRTAAVSQNDRANELGMRCATYRSLTSAAEVVLRDWLARACMQFLQALHGD